jgi:hypothetical protein
MARDRELFGNAVRTTAGLYAALVAARAFDDVVSGVPFGRRRALEPFAEAGEDFIQAFSHRLVDTMMSAPPVRVGLREPAAGNASITPAGTPVEARRAALVRAALLIPETWVPVYRKVLGDVDPEAIELCQSCSASISHHRGISERYCRFCADERGTLRPRPEVERMLAGWLRMWERGLTADEALEGASRFMSRMPAWSMN